MQFITLNQILKIISQICANHLQINSYNFGQEFEISASEQEKYPLVWADLMSANIEYLKANVVINIKVMDIQKADSSNEKDTLSDTLSISRDIIAELNSPSYQDYFMISDNVSMTPLRESLPDLVNGWSFDINFELMELNDRCQVPNI